MNYSIITEYSLLLLFPIAIIAGLLTYHQYIKQNLDEDKYKTYFLASLRFVAIMVLSFIVLNPQIKSKKEINIKPKLLWLQDVSRSIILSKDSIYYKNSYFKDISKAQNVLSEKYDIINIDFDSKIRLNKDSFFSGTETNINKAISYIKNNYYSSKNSLVVLASDGIYNKGNNPRYKIGDLNMPIYTLILGDTIQTKDLIITDIKTNKIAFVNSKLPIIAKINARQLKGGKTKLKLYNKNKLLYTKDIFIKSADEYISEEIMLDIKTAGLQTYTIKLSQIRGETNIANNKMKFAVDVKDKRRKILMLFDRYHPDIAAINGALKSDINFDFSYSTYDKYTEDLSKLNMIILYQAQSKSIKFIREAKRLKIPILYIIGTYTDLNFINSNNLGFRLNSKINDTDDVQFAKNEKFDLFKNDASDINILENLPPLSVPFVNLSFDNEVEILANQKVKGLKTKKALIAFWNNEEIKNAIIMGEGLWKWKYYNYLKENNHEVFNKLINNICQYISLIQERDKLILDYQRIFTSSDIISISAEIYNKSYQRVNEKKLNIKLTNDENINFKYEFLPNKDSYYLEIEDLPVGKYSFTCFTEDSKLSSKGNFIVTQDKLEERNTIANIAIMRKIALLSDAKFFTKNKLDNLVIELNNEDKFKSTISESSSFKKLISIWPLLVLCLLLISIEWFFRKLWSL